MQNSNRKQNNQNLASSISPETLQCNQMHDKHYLHLIILERGRIITTQLSKFSSLLLTMHSPHCKSYPPCKRDAFRHLNQKTDYLYHLIKLNHGNHYLHHLIGAFTWITRIDVLFTHFITIKFYSLVTNYQPYRFIQRVQNTYWRLKHFKRVCS